MRKFTASLLAVLLLLGCSQPASSSSAPEVTPASVAEDEYAAGNVILKIKETNMSGYRWLEDDDPAFAQVTMTESFRIFEEKGTALILYSYDTCPWCNRAVPVLNKVLKENGIKNGVEHLEIVGRERLKELEPAVGHVPVAALYAPTAGIVCPFGATIAFAENAYTNGVDFRFNTEVKGLTRSEDEEGKPYWIVQTAEGVLQTRAVVNAAGVYSDILHNMVSADKIRIVPRKGDYLLLDRRTGGYVQHTVFQVPGKFGKGVLVSPTVHGNTIIGPTAEDIEDKEGVDTTAEGFDDLMEKAGLAFDDLPLREVITSFAGLRAHEARHDFILGEASDAPGFFDCAGIESPGLTAAPAIGKEIAAQLAEKLGLAEDPDFVGTRKGFIDPKALDLPDLAELIKEKPEYGRIVCRCEQVSEGEIRDAIRRPLGARSLDGVKRRVRAGMGRCQAGFCSPRIMDILAEELGVDVADITKSGGHSEVIVGLVKDRV